MRKADPPNGLAAEIGKRSPFESRAQEAYLNLVRTCETLGRHFDHLFRQHGLSAPQYNVLRIVRGHGRRGVPTRQIAREMVTREPDVSRLIDRLEQADLVARRRCAEDRRVVRVALSPPGAALLTGLDQPVRDLHEQQLGHLGDRRLATLIRLLTLARETPRAT